ncbi:hypothetical protein [Photobacterium lipolyticum]|uniref:Uncharacterized protein n=1 Tax=Photobacterium lipolyticum TaxID=266810 RepID=A0A2T3MS15_9GAMM|nr:hypothetical protein [Photobacterium lipolyticum]PSW00293.1 hypothetical protein C9I89_21330 [Photobacterium lipolyticum]
MKKVYLGCLIVAFSLVGCKTTETSEAASEENTNLQFVNNNDIYNSQDLYTDFKLTAANLPKDKLKDIYKETLEWVAQEELLPNLNSVIAKRIESTNTKKSLSGEVFVDILGNDPVLTIYTPGGVIIPNYKDWLNQINKSWTEYTKKISTKSITNVELLNPKKVNLEPIRKLRNYDISAYYANFEAIKENIQSKYPELYVSSPQLYVTDDELISVSPWLVTPLERTMFSSTHIVALSYYEDGELKTNAYNQKALLNALKTKYVVQEFSDPTFHYILKIDKKDLPSFENDVRNLISTLDPK